MAVHVFVAADAHPDIVEETTPAAVDTAEDTALNVLVMAPNMFQSCPFGSIILSGLSLAYAYLLKLCGSRLPAGDESWVMEVIIVGQDYWAGQCISHPLTSTLVDA